MIAVAAWHWNPEMADKYVFGRGDSAVIVPPLSVTETGAERLAEGCRKLVVLSQAVQNNMDPKPAKPESLMMTERDPNPTAHLQWDSGRSIMVITPPMVVSLMEAKRVHKQLGELIAIAETV